MNTSRIGSSLLLCLTLAGAAPALALPLLSLRGPATAALGSRFTLDLQLADVADLYAFQADLRFDPRLLAPDAVSEGTFLPALGPTVFLPGSPDRAGGRIAFVLGSLVGAASGASGSGSLAAFSFAALHPGRAEFTLENVLLLDTSLNPITADLAGASVALGPALLPAPATPVLVLPLLAWLLHRAKRLAGSRRKR